MSESGTNHSPKQNSAASCSQRPRSIHGVALDMDGLLFDTERLYWHVGDTVLIRRGRRFCAALQQRMMGRVGLAAIQEMIEFHDLSDSPDELLEESNLLFGDLLTDGLHPMPGLQQWIELLQKSGIPFGLATSSQRRFVEVILSTTEWHQSLAFLLTGDDVTCGKPHPEMYLKAAEKLSIEPHEMLVLEDSGNGCAAAVAAGAQTVAVPNEYTRRQDFDGAVLVAESLTDPKLWSMLR